MWRFLVIEKENDFAFSLFLKKDFSNSGCLSTWWSPSCGTTNRLRTDTSSGVVKSQDCLSSVLISFFFVSKTVCPSFSCCCVVLHSTQCSELRQTVVFPIVTQSVHFHYPRSCLRSNSFLTGRQSRSVLFRNPIPFPF